MKDYILTSAQARAVAGNQSEMVEDLPLQPFPQGTLFPSGVWEKACAALLDDRSI
jgi:hypothetical protein